MNQLTPSLAEVLDFLSSLFDAGSGYSALCTARAALASTVELSGSHFSLGTHPLITRFIKGVYNGRPSVPRYTSTWDVSTVLKYLQDKAPAEDLSLKELTLKLVMLCLLVTGARGQTLHVLDIKNMVQGDSFFTFEVAELIKTSKPGQAQPKIHLQAYTEDNRLCVVTCLSEYLERTKLLRPDSTTRLFLSYTKPHRPVSRDTISRWVRTTMAAAGLDTNLYKPHSTRAASSSAAALKATPIDIILNTAGWSSAKTFAKYYHKHIQQNTGQYSNNVLSTV